MPKGARGFGLIELLAALAILGLIITVVMQLFQTGLRGVDRVSTHVRALALAEATLATVSADQGLRPGRWQGNFNGLRWVLAIQPDPDPAFADSARIGLAAYSVAVTVEFGGGGRVTLETIRLTAAP